MGKITVEIEIDLDNCWDQQDAETAIRDALKRVASRVVVDSWGIQCETVPRDINGNRIGAVTCDNAAGVSFSETD